MACQHSPKWPFTAGHYTTMIAAMKGRLTLDAMLDVAALALAMCAVTALLVAPAGAGDDDARKPGAACDAPAHHQFDFWLGEWDVRDATGKLVGRNRISRVEGGCALQEQWSGNGGVTGTSLNVFDLERKRWHQTWVDNTGGLLLLDGAYVDGRMVLTGQAAAAPGASVQQQRIAWQAFADGRVRQLWEASRDGTAWSVVFDGYYTRRPTVPVRGAVE
jgi:hypothetical protein